METGKYIPIRDDRRSSHESLPSRILHFLRQYISKLSHAVIARVGISPGGANGDDGLVEVRILPSGGAVREGEGGVAGREGRTKRVRQCREILDCLVSLGWNHKSMHFKRHFPLPFLNHSPQVPTRHTHFQVRAWGMWRARLVPRQHLALPFQVMTATFPLVLFGAGGKGAPRAVGKGNRDGEAAAMERRMSW